MSGGVSVLVTGAAGFIGSQLAARLAGEGREVTGIDAFTDYYDLTTKRANAEAAQGVGVELVEADLRTVDLAPLLDGVDTVFHQAAQPGVRASWDHRFADYATHNVLATQRLLEAARHAGVQRFVYASSSSIYGNALTYPTFEDTVPAPFSPYGVTKLAAEHLCGLYASNYGTPTVSLRYFTVYGPRQRPDMAMHRLVEAALSDRPFPLYGDGSHVRDFTFVGDIGAANVAAAGAEGAPGTVLNVCAGGSTTMRAVIDAISEAVGRPLRVDRLPEQPGDVHRTGGDNACARELLAWKPSTTLQEGIAAQVAWHRRPRQERR